MAKKKAELEEDAARYQQILASARQAQKDGQHRRAVEIALSSWSCIDGMLQFARRYEDRSLATVETIDLVLKYAPLLLDYESLNKLGNLLSETRRIERNTSDNLGDKLARAREKLCSVYRLWDFIEQHPGTDIETICRAMGQPPHALKPLLKDLSSLGLLLRDHDSKHAAWSLATRLGQVIRGKCTRCGQLTEAPKAALLKAGICPHCQEQTSFVLQPHVAAPSE